MFSSKDRSVSFLGMMWLQTYRQVTETWKYSCHHMATIHSEYWQEIKSVNIHYIVLLCPKYEQMTS